MSEWFLKDRLVGLLSITVLRAYGLPSVATFGPNSLMVSIGVNLDKQRTKTLQDVGPSGEWNTTLLFPVDAFPGDLVHAKVKHDSNFRDTTIGIFSLSLGELLAKQGKTLRLQLVDPEEMGNPAGVLEIVARFQRERRPRDHVDESDSSSDSSAASSRAGSRATTPTPSPMMQSLRGVAVPSPVPSPAGSSRSLDPSPRSGGSAPTTSTSPAAAPFLAVPGTKPSPALPSPSRVYPSLGAETASSAPTASSPFPVASIQGPVVSSNLTSYSSSTSTNGGSMGIASIAPSYSATSAASLPALPPHALQTPPPSGGPVCTILPPVVAGGYATPARAPGSSWGVSPIFSVARAGGSFLRASAHAQMSPGAASQAALQRQQQQFWPQGPHFVPAPSAAAAVPPLAQQPAHYASASSLHQQQQQSVYQPYQPYQYPAAVASVPPAQHHSQHPQHDAAPRGSPQLTRKGTPYVHSFSPPSVVARPYASHGAGAGAGGSHPLSPPPPYSPPTASPGHGGHAAPSYPSHGANNSHAGVGAPGHLAPSHTVAAHQSHSHHAASASHAHNNVRSGSSSFSPAATPLVGSLLPRAEGINVSPFDDRAHLGLRGDARVCELRVWASARVHGLQLQYATQGPPGAPPLLLEGSLAGHRGGTCSTLHLAEGDALTDVAGRFGVDGALEVLVVGTRRGEQRLFGGEGIEEPDAASTEFVLRIPLRHRVVGFKGGVTSRGHICALGAYTASME